jgi:exopolysaccharide biosynthesis polyprenyl glycosylphosphotransferase
MSVEDEVRVARPPLVSDTVRVVPDPEGRHVERSETLRVIPDQEDVAVDTLRVVPDQDDVAVDTLRDLPDGLDASAPTTTLAVGEADHAEISGGTEPWQRRYRTSVLMVDVLVAIDASILTLLIRPAAFERAVMIVSAMLLPLVWVGLLGMARAYDERIFGVGSDEYRRVLSAGVALVASAAFVAYALQLTVARGFVLVVLPFTVLLDLAGRYLLRRRLHRRRSRGECMKRVVIVGDDRSALGLVTQLRRRPFHGLEPVAVCLTYGSDHTAVQAAGLPTMVGVERAVEAVRAHQADVVAVLTGPVMAGPNLRRLSWDLEGTDAELLVSAGLIEVAGPRVHVTPVDGLPLLNLAKPRFSGFSRVGKGLFDRITALATLIVLSPVLLAIAVAIRRTSPGPVFFRQTRIGRAGREFKMIKFRSMVTNAEEVRADLLDQSDRDGLMFKMHDDPRITSVGRWMRRYSLDELPQLLNVVMGQMSLVGPRPPLAEEVSAYDDEVKRRLLVKPGMTGLWQVSGRSDLAWEESVRLDLRYVDNWSIAFDVVILWKTFRAVVHGEGAY